MRRNFSHASSQQHNGLTLLEVIVVILIIITLLALILPAIRIARGSRRRLECQNNLKILALAAHNFASQRQGQLPPSGRWRNNDFTSEPHGMDNWVVVLMPHLDRRDVADKWQYDQPFDSVANSETARVRIRFLSCPQDDNFDPDRRKLSYVANHGYAAFHESSNYWDQGGVDWNRNSVLNSANAPDCDPADADAHRAPVCFGNCGSRPAAKGPHEHDPATQTVYQSMTSLME